MIKLMIPDMPTADDLLPYLRRIDAVRHYSNNGPMVQELEARLEQLTGAPCVTTSNGTLVLELVLRARRVYAGEPIEVPAFTFSATGLAARNAGYIMVLVDVDECTWQMSLKHAGLGRVPVLPVATLGTPVDYKAWEGMPFPVTIDAAGAFPAQHASEDQNIATCFSLHATKFIGCGEGGFVASHNRELIERVRSMASFGMGGTNAKMSEYHAAVALASLDKVEDKMMRTAWRKRWYDKHLPSEWRMSQLTNSSNGLSVLLPVSAEQVIPRMLAAGIETKQWYRPLLDEREEFGHYCPRGRLPVTEYLRTHLLGLPFHNFLTEGEVEHVCKTLKEVCNE